MRALTVGGIVMSLTACGGTNPKRAAPEAGAPDAAALSSDAAALSSDAGWSSLTDWSRLPTLGADSYRQFSSSDRGRQHAGIPLGNKDFDNFLNVCGNRTKTLLEDDDGSPSCDPGIEGWLLASADDGPGFVSRIFLAVGTLGPDLNPLTADPSLGPERIRIYTDDLGTPAYEAALTEWQAGTSPPFVPPLTTYNRNVLVSYVPVSYEQKLRVVLDGLRTPRSLYYYQVDVQSVAATTSFSPKTLSSLVPTVQADLARRATEGTAMWADGESTLSPGQVLTVLDRAGSGTISHVHVTVSRDLSATLSDLALRITWDGQAAPAIDLPLATLFACRPEPSSFETLPMSVRVNGDGAELDWLLPMPFSSQATVALVNGGASVRSARLRIDGKAAVPPGEWGTLRAFYQQQAAPVPASAQYSVLDVSGRGRYAGTIMMLTGGPAPGWKFHDPMNFLEGDETGTLDGVTSIRGTGTEEFFDGGFYFSAGRYDSLFASLVSISTTGSGGDASDATGQATAVRWNVPSDGIAFDSGFRLQLEYGADTPATLREYDSVAFYYAR